VILKLIEGAFMRDKINQSWCEVLKGEFEKSYFQFLVAFVDNAYSSTVVYPEREKVFEAFNRTPFDKVKVVIIGQDPYHEPGQAQGLSFYVPEGVKPPPSLRNIAQELGKMPDLLSWADQGVLLLNTTLTVQAHKPLSHQGKGWEIFTDAAIKALSEKRENIVFILWGSYAQKKGALIDDSKHFIIKSAHPSPLSAYRGFFGSKPFSRTNDFLVLKKIEPIQW
jgi:uracil-DNA glycosylase